MPAAALVLWLDVVGEIVIGARAPARPARTHASGSLQWCRTERSMASASVLSAGEGARPEGNTLTLTYTRYLDSPVAVARASGGRRRSVLGAAGPAAEGLVLTASARAPPAPSVLLPLFRDVLEIGRGACARHRYG